MSIEFVEECCVLGEKARAVRLRGGIEFEAPPLSGTKIRVVGAGGAGGNALNTMIRSGLTGVDFIAVNTDMQALEKNLAPTKIQLGEKITRGLGSGGDPEVGRRSAMADRDRIHEVLEGADMVFVTAGMGGGTGTGGAPIIADVARECGALAVGVVTKPFTFEGKVRMRQAEEGTNHLKRSAHTLITIPNEQLLRVIKKTTTLRDAFKKADEVLQNAVRGISEVITVPGLVNVDFSDVRTIMCEMGPALMGEGVGKGKNRAVEAAEMAISSPLLEDLSIEGARGILVNVTAGDDLTLLEVNAAIGLIQERAHIDAHLIFGAVIDESLSDEVRITVVATGIGRTQSPSVECEKRVVNFVANSDATGRLESSEENEPAPVPSFLERKHDRTVHSNTGGGGASTLRDVNLDEPAFLRQAVQIPGL